MREFRRIVILLSLFSFKKSEWEIRKRREEGCFNDESPLLRKPGRATQRTLSSVPRRSNMEVDLIIEVVRAERFADKINKAFLQ